MVLEHCVVLNELKLRFKEIGNMISEHWSRDLAKRLEWHQQRDIRQVVEDNLGSLNMEENVLCTICLSRFKAAEEVCQFRCHESHLFHKECILPWLIKKNECPICKQKVYQIKYKIQDGDIRTLNILLNS